MPQNGFDSSDGAPSSGFVITEFAPAGIPGRIGVATCPGVRDKRFRPELLRADLDEVELWGATAVLVLLRPEGFDNLAIERLTHEVRSRGIGCVVLHAGDGAPFTDAFRQDWRRVSGRLEQALRRGERLLVHCNAEGRRTAIVAAWLMIEAGAEPEVALAAVRAGNPDAIEGEAEAAAVTGYVRGG